MARFAEPDDCGCRVEDGRLELWAIDTYCHRLMLRPALPVEPGRWLHQSSFSLAMLNLFIRSTVCVRLTALLVRNTQVLTIRWSDQDVVARITRVNLMLRRSRCLVRTKSVRCQWPEWGCIQLPLYLSACWKTVLVTTRLCAIQNCSSNEPFAFLLPIPRWPTILFHTLKTLPTLALKSPRMNSWCMNGAVLVALLSWS